MMKVTFAGLALFTVAAPALAHHSYAMFDTSKTYTIQGVVKEWQWANPHVWVAVRVPGGPSAGEWSFEGGAIQVMRRQGWDRTAIKVGDKVTITAHPLKSGIKGGSLIAITLADGRHLLGGGRPGDTTDPNIVERPR